MRPIDLLFGPSQGEVEAAKAHLADHFEGEAAREADCLARVYRRLGARRTARICWAIGHRLVAFALAASSSGAAAGERKG